MRLRGACALVLLAGCAAGPHPLATPRAEPAWHTLRAEHRVALDVVEANGTHEHRTLRGAIVVERPDRFRLRALGPGGITLFDLLWVQGRVKVLASLADPERGSMQSILRALAGDLAAAYRLAPAEKGRRVQVTRDAVIVHEPGRTVRLSDFERVGTSSTFTHMRIENSAGYRVDVTVPQVILDVPLDRLLFYE